MLFRSQLNFQQGFELRSSSQVEFGQSACQRPRCAPASSYTRNQNQSFNLGNMIYSVSSLPILDNSCFDSLIVFDNFLRWASSDPMDSTAPRLLDCRSGITGGLIAPGAGSGFLEAASSDILQVWTDLSLRGYQITTNQSAAVAGDQKRYNAA